MVKEIPIRSALKSEKNGLKIMIVTWLETIQKYLHVALKFKHFHISLYRAPPLKKKHCKCNLKWLPLSSLHLKCFLSSFRKLSVFNILHYRDILKSKVPNAIHVSSLTCIQLQYLNPPNEK